MRDDVWNEANANISESQPLCVLTVRFTLCLFESPSHQSAAVTLLVQYNPCRIRQILGVVPEMTSVGWGVCSHYKLLVFRQKPQHLLSFPFIAELSLTGARLVTRVSHTLTSNYTCSFPAHSLKLLHDTCCLVIFYSSGTCQHILSYFILSLFSFMFKL